MTQPAARIAPIGSEGGDQREHRGAGPGLQVERATHPVVHVVAEPGGSDAEGEPHDQRGADVDQVVRAGRRRGQRRGCDQHRGRRRARRRRLRRVLAACRGRPCGPIGDICLCDRLRSLLGGVRDRVRIRDLQEGRGARHMHGQSAGQRGRRYVQETGSPREHGPRGHDVRLGRHVGRVAATGGHGRGLDGHDRLGVIEGFLREHQRASRTDCYERHGQDPECVHYQEPRR